MTKLSDIDDQRLSSLIGDFMICKRCGIVDREHSRIKVDNPCPSCHKPAGRAQLYFHLNIQILIDLIQQAYNSKSPPTGETEPNSSNVAVVIFFCALREALLEHLFIYLFSARKTSEPKAEKLLKDNRLFNQKLSTLFPELIGLSWDKAIENIASANRMDFCSVSVFMKNMANLRNKFIHEGSVWGITKEIATDCVNNTFGMLQLFVALHNAYVQPQLCKTKT